MGVKISFAGTYDCPEYMLTIRGRNQSTDWCAEYVDHSVWGVSNAEKQQLEEAIKVLGITPNSGPGWIVYAIYG